MPLGEALRQGVLVDLPVASQHIYQRQRHLGVVGVGPGRCRQRTLVKQTSDQIRVVEKALAEGVAD